MISTDPIPQPLKKGDTVGIIAPSGQLQQPELFQSGIKILKEMGFRVKFPRELWPGKSYFADSDENRAQEINNLFKDEDVQGIVALRGGYGCIRILDKIDLQLIARNPKPVIGYSDITILQNFLFDRLGWASFHGPVLTSLASVDKISLHSFYNSLVGLWKDSFSTIKMEILRDHPSVAGPIVGGNLSSMTTLLGTEYDFSWNDKIVFLEDINEPVYKIDRMITQLYLAGKFKGAVGLILGDFSHKSHQDDLERIRYKEAVWERIIEITEEFNFPVWAQFPSGHCTTNLTFPIGVKLQMNHSKGKLIPC